MHSPTKVIFEGLGSLLLALSLIFPANAENKSISKEHAMSAVAQEKMSTHCLGRFQVDLPADAEYVAGSHEYSFATIESKAISYEAFLQELDAFEAKLKSAKHKSGSMLLLKKTAADEKSRVLSFWDDYNSTILINTFGYRWIDGMRYQVRTTPDPDKMEIATSHVGSILSHLSAPSNEVPSTPGFCIAHGMISDEGSSKSESIKARFRLKSRPDIVIDIATTRNSGTPPESLLLRKPSVFSALGALGATLSGISTVREGDRKVGGMPGQEWLLKAPNDDGHQAHLFTWEAPGLRRDALHPQVRIDLQSANNDGGRDPAPASLTNPQMLELWERILNSLRLRSINGGQAAEVGNSSPQAHSGSVLPLGELVRTGASCPQTGYWQCPENDVHGSTRLFKSGDPMPPAIIKRDLSFVERLRGSSDQHSSSTVWRLVRYDEPIAINTPTALGNDDAIKPSSDA
ncbi:T6SS immunity protein Tli4 family protein [Duganella sp. Root336D2]|uniref:T6SS immunity protein Tli4 family protein n=1 Tax=Duganella sp. Root336D2 TaxID=1736518 RepID=UPI000700CC36|nr:T6SS immunity protein Tli4 family protein [Duganella sp. Root336D2]KQV59052.1 hypothetical protein ASD07_25785 [Duganella sp. Root336D2]